MTTFTDELKLVITVDPSGAVSVLKGFGDQATGDLSKVQGGAGKSGAAAGEAYSTNFANTALLGLQAVQSAVATLGVISFAKSAITSADTFARANLQLAAQLAATGQSAGVTAGDVDSLAASLQKTQDVFAGTVRQGAALLLTFTDIQNKPGAGNEIFNRALTDATAISNVFGKDLPSAIAQLGRALEDPLTGIISLQKGGLAIAEQDKERVRALAQQGDLLGAQSALLDAIENKGILQSGAAAGQDPIQRLQTEIETFKVAVGTDFLPILRAIATGLDDTLQAFSALPAPVRATIEVLGAVSIAGLAATGTILGLRAAYGALEAVRLAAKGTTAVDVVDSIAFPVDAVEGFNIAAAQAVGTVADLNAEIVAVGASGGSIASVVASFDEFNVAAATAGQRAAATATQIAAIGVDGSGFSVVTDEATAFDVAAAAASAEVGTLETALVSIGSEGAPGIAAITAEIESAGTQLDLFGGEVAQIVEQLSLISAETGTLSVSLGQTVDEFSGLSESAAAAAQGAGGLGANFEALNAIATVTVSATEQIVSADAELAEAYAALGGEIINVTQSIAGMTDELSGLSGAAFAAATGTTGLSANLAAVAAATAAVAPADAELAEAWAGLGGEASALTAEFAGMVDELSGLGPAAAAAATGTAGLGTSLATLGAEMAVVAPADAELADVFAALEAQEAALTEETGFLAAALSSLGAVGASVGASFAGVGLLGSLGAVAAGFAAYTVTYNVLKGVVGGDQTPFAKLSQDTDRLKTDLGTLDKQNSQLTGNGLSAVAGFATAIGHSAQQASTDIKTLNSGLKSIADTQGPAAAYQAFLQLQTGIENAGGSVSDLDSYLGSAVGYIHQLYVEANNAKQGLDGFAAQFAALGGGVLTAASDNIALAQSYQAVADAQAKVANDNADIAGTGTEAVAATNAEKNAYGQLVDAINGVDDAKQRLADAYQSLADAQYSAVQSAHSLLEAQEALDEYNSPRGVEERSLQQDIINRRVVTTPAGEDQKRLDQLQFTDTNNNREQQLQDSVNSAQHSYADALNAVAKAQRGITDAQDGVKKATDNVTTAENNFKDAIAKRAQVASDAHKALITDELAAQAAIAATGKLLVTMAQNGELANADYLTSLKKIADQLLPGGAFRTGLDAALDASILTYQLSLATNPNNTNYGDAPRGRPHEAVGPSSSSSAGGAGDPFATLFRLLGLPVPPGFADGGVVPGFPGSPQLIKAHGGEVILNRQQQQGAGAPLVHQENHFYGESGTKADLDAANARLAWGIARTGRGN